jgi:hypothetical protein
MADHPREFGRELAAARSTAGAIPNLDAALLSVFGPTRALLLALAYWRAGGEPSDRPICALCEAAIADCRIALESLQNEGLARSFVEICESLSLFEEQGIDPKLIAEFKARTVALCENIRVKLLLIGCPRQSRTIAALDTILVHSSI